MRSLSLVISFLFVLSVFPGCGPTSRLNNGLINRLADRGPVPLSLDNPYLAANLFVSKEMAKTEEVKGFLNYRGAPGAIELLKSTFSPLTVHFLYPEKKEYFLFEESLDSWVINGPYRLNAAQERALAAIAVRDSENKGAAPKLLNQEQDNTKVNPAVQESQTTPAPRDSMAANQIGTGRSVQSSLVQENQELPAIKDIISTSAHESAELTPKGDLVHYVTLPGETLSIIARWYTEDRDNAGRIARINKLARPDNLAIGDTIVIPSYLLRNKNRLTAEAYEKLRALIKK